MRKRTAIFCVSVLAAFVLVQTALHAQAREDGFRAIPLEVESQFELSKQRTADGMVSILVKLEDAPLAVQAAGLPDLASPQSRTYSNHLDRKLADFEDRCRSMIPNARMGHRFKILFGGVAMRVPEDQVDQVAGLPGVVAVYRDELRQLDTERSPRFIGANRMWRQLGGRSEAGEGTVVGVLDSGVWPEHPSYSDPDPSGKPYPPPAVVPGSNGFAAPDPRSTCDFGNTAYNPNDAPFTCNNKLIGAYDFTDTYKALLGLLPEEFDSARDANGHGTHTSSTAAGNFGVEAELFGVPRGIVSGIAPRAHIIMYKVCGEDGCYNSDSLMAVEQAILDGVDVINFSISGGSSPYTDIVEQAFLDAYEQGVFVAASAGNSGPGPDTVSHRGPWVTTVAASTTNRHFLSELMLSADNGDTLMLEGATVTDGIIVPTEVVFPPAGDELCLTPFAPGTFSGEIVICERGAIARVAKSYNVAAGGAGGLILYNPVMQGVSTDNHFIPSIHIESDAGTALLDFMSAHTGVMATFTEGVASRVRGDVMASFSSRGGPGQTLGVSKPDVTAPGVQILAGHTPLPAIVDGGLPGELFQVIQGTSMSGPHVAGAAALLMDLHPEWGPGDVKSALMTTAIARRVRKEDGVTRADPFDYGSGRINLRRAGNPGLIFEPPSALDYAVHESDLWNANYPSLYIPVHPGRMTVERTLRSELSYRSLWFLWVSSPRDVDIKMPKAIKIAARGTKTIKIMVDARNVSVGETRFATLHMTDGRRKLDFPIVINREQQVVTLTKSCDPTTMALYGMTDCTMEVTNTSFDDADVRLIDQLPKQLALVGDVNGADKINKRLLRFEGTLDGAEPPAVMVDSSPGGSPGGYLPLSLFGIAPIGGVADETLVNFNVDPFVYASETYTAIGVVSNGYAVVGGGTLDDIDFINQVFPDPNPPNNVLAPFWTDLNFEAGGDLRVAYLSGGGSWLVLDWENVPNFTDGVLNSFQIWIGVNGVEDISYTYGSVSSGDGELLTVGAENAFGNRGYNYYANESGTPVVAGDELRVTSEPPEPGETLVVTFTAQGVGTGRWQNCAELEGDLFQGTSLACVEGRIRGRVKGKQSRK